MFRILLILPFLLLSIAGIAQDLVTIKGRLITSDGKPALGVHIFVKNSKTVTYSNHEGAFVLKVIPGKQILRIHSNIQTEEKEVHLEIAHDQEIAPIILNVASNELKQVVVTGQHTPQALQKSVFTIHTIPQEKIRMSAATNVQQVLMTEPGVRFNNDLTLGTADIELNGMSGRNIKILVDGVPMLDRSDARESLNQIDINLIDRIEIVEGPMSVIYGSDALAGVINIITKVNTSSVVNISAKVQEESIGKEYNFGKGKGNHHKNLAVNWAKNKYFANISVTSNDFGGWNLPPKNAFISEVNAITDKWKPKQQLMENIQLGYKQANFSIWYRLMALQEEIDTRYGINPNNYIAKFQKYTTNRSNHLVQSNWNINSKNVLQTMIGITDLTRKTKTTLHDYNTNTSTLSSDQGEQDIAKFTNIFLRTTWQHKWTENLSLQPGFEFNRETAEGARIKGNPTINDYAFFISVEYKPLNYLTVRPGARYIKNSVYSAPNFVPSINTKIDLYPNLDLRLSYAKGYRAPALRELYFDFIDASHTIIGNENLKAEKSNSFNAALNWRELKVGKWEFKSVLTGFYNIFKDRIDYAYDSNDPSVTTLLNIDKYKTTGFVLNNTFSLTHIKMTLGFSYIGRYNRLSTSMEEVSPFSWTPEIFGDLTYQIKKWDTTAILFVKKTGKRSAYQIVDGQTNTVTLSSIEGITWADFMLNKKFKRNITINLGVKNLFNVTNQTNTGGAASGGAHSSSSTINTSYGRSYVVGLAYLWNKI